MYVPTMMKVRVHRFILFVIIIMSVFITQVDCCKDKAKFVFKVILNGDAVKKTCEWITKKPNQVESRRELACDVTSTNGKVVREACQKSCDSCSSNQPSVGT